jgi:hypothetical protein
MSFSFSVQSLMNRLVFWCAYASCEVLDEAHIRGWFLGFLLGTLSSALDTNARAFPVYDDVPPALCKFAAIKNVKGATRSCPGSRPVSVALVGIDHTDNGLGSSYPQYPSRVVLVICNASNGVPLVGFGI